MKIIFFTVLFLFFLQANLQANDFISAKEYSKMLYENPRGIGCNKCHGANGEMQILGHYEKKGKRTAFVVPSIQNLGFEEFKKSLNETKEASSIMPSYSLTENEILVLYNYIQEKTKEQNNAKQ
ncbi:hypothetical protein [uncultured Campylobacter sp.]|uniref:c-type cytochrome n=1 Tax=uncultured Campylobacter sp. TaxID=218934 RepID=UPI002619B4ED|nr:hypothetical protein [uncultured Campylobacter sp.]